MEEKSDPTSPLCNDKPQTLEHMLSSCKTALGNGRYTWRHNRILDKLFRFIKNYIKSEQTISTQKFVSEWGRIYANNQNFLGSSGDWAVSANLSGWHNDYPKTIYSKGLQPDIVLLSRANLKIIMVELSISYESQMEQSYK